MLDICSVFHKIYERFWLSVLMLREKMYVFTEYTFFVGAVYRYYESRRRIYNDSQPSRLAAKKTNERRNKIRNRQRQVL